MDPSNYPSSSSSARAEEDNHDDNRNIREHMFDKVVTPSDVGKLNRLVIPKQHAEKYFPLDSDRNRAGPDSGEPNNSSKGLLLNFEDRTGKSWRFRYSYWNSSQSYVMTKGWSRFVKEKKLDAGDIVSFHRGGDKFYIDWRRRPRPDNGAAALLVPPPLLHFSFHRPPPPGGGWIVGGGGGGGVVSPGGFVLRSSQPYDRDPQYPYHHHHHHHQHQQHQGVIWDHLRRPMLPSVPHPHWIRTTTTSSSSHRQVLPPPPPPLPSSSSLSSMMGDHHHHHHHHHHHDHDHGVVHGEEGGGERMVFDSVPVVQGKAAAAGGKRLRLFGVNMDCSNNSNSRDSFELYHDHHHIHTSSPSITSDHHHRIVQDDDQLPGLQLSLPVDKGKLSSSSSPMSLDLDM